MPRHAAENSLEQVEAIGLLGAERMLDWPGRGRGRVVKAIGIISGRPATASPSANGLNGAPAFSPLQRWLLLAAFTLLVIFRLPNAWAEGRFQDEEATVFLAYAWHFPWDEALFRPFAGYWNLAANATTVLAVQMIRADMLSLERAPYLTMTIALVFQMVPAALILTGKAPWLAKRWAVIAALLMIAITPATEEVFVNVMHIQFHLSLGVALILAFDVPRRRIANIGYGAVLFLAPLCGPGAIVLLPLFALRWLIDREPGRLWQIAVLATGATVQLLLFFNSNPTRGLPIEPLSMMAGLFLRLIVLPTIGPGYANHIADAVTGPLGGQGPWLWPMAAAVAVLLGALFALASQRRDSGLWFALSGLLLAAITFGVGFVSVNPVDMFYVTAGERYNFLPLVLLGLTLIVLSTREGFGGKRICAALCALLILNGVGRYPEPVAVLANGPSWPDEVRAWRIDRRHPLAVWPAPWAADLSDDHRPCSPPAQDVTKSTDPRYCESGWVASFYRRKTR